MTDYDYCIHSYPSIHVFLVAICFSREKFGENSKFQKELSIQKDITNSMEVNK